jgi:hypothetical protein
LVKYRKMSTPCAWQQEAETMMALLAFPAKTTYDFNERTHVRLAKLLPDSCGSIKCYAYSNITLEFRTDH